MGGAKYTVKNFVNSILNLNKCSAQEKKEQEWGAGPKLRQEDRFFKICSVQEKNSKIFSALETKPKVFHHKKKFLKFVQ